ncbi:MAG: type II secretion system protein [Synergistaceae bacterium]|jgi:prepilin-type N-terminal cleavage/methylation domain-containing protein|nr:type II secretion system protein [Synergistaceae bacterium]
MFKNGSVYGLWRWPNCSKGFTLVELLVAIIIIAFLVGVAVLSSGAASDKQRLQGLFLACEI